MDEKMNVLIVDDEPLNITVLMDLLKDDYRLVAATNGRQALERAVAHPQPDLILLDIMMPEIDGYEVCRLLMADEKTRRIPVVFISALGQIGDEAKGLELGAIDYITKPISPSILQARVKNHLQFKIYRDRLENLAMVDGLTGIANRRRLDDYLAAELNRARRNKSQLSVMMIDIDFFKLFNDNYGHVAGDECLKTVAAALSGAVHRPADLVARYGGEEFVCILPDSDAEKVFYLAEKMLDAVKAAGVRHEHSTVADVVSISLGCLTVDGSQNLASVQIIEEADKLLYRSKEGGRNLATVGFFEEQG